MSYRHDVGVGAVLLWSTVLVLVIIATIVGFRAFEPTTHNSNYWVAMGDILAMECVVAGYSIWTFLIAAGLARAGLTPAAMKMSLSMTLALFLVVGIVISLIFAVLSADSTSLELTFRTTLVAKWLLLLIIVASMWTAGREGSQTRALQEESRNSRAAILQQIDGALSGMRAVQGKQSSSAEWNATMDEIETTCNRVKGWVSARNVTDGSNSEMARLAAELVSLCTSSGRQSDGVADDLLGSIQTKAREISEHVRADAVSRRAGVA